MTRRALIAAALISAVALTGCANSQKDSDKKVETAVSVEKKAPATTSASATAHNHAADGGAAPAGIATASNPKFPVGSTVTLTADHMPGMKGAEAKVVGAYKTDTYAVSYQPTNGGAAVKEHKWVVKEETTPAANGKVTLNADHVAGMKGAEATIEYTVQETVYMVDVVSGEMPMKNHKWVTESEMKG